MKAIFALVALVLSTSAFAGEPGYGYPQNQPAPIEQLEPDAPCVAPCGVRPRCPPYGCGNVYQQIPQKACQLVFVGQTRHGQLYGIVRFGRYLITNRLETVINADINHFTQTLEGDGRPYCETVFQ